MQSVATGRYNTVALAFVDQGFNAAVAVTLAWGVVAKMLNHAYVRLDDDMGTVTDLEKLVHWDGPTGRLALAMSQTAFIKIINDRVYLVEAIKEASESTLKRWRKSERYRPAYERSLAAFAPKPAVTGQVEEIGLFGSLEQLKPKDENERSEHTKLVAYWTALWGSTYTPRKYPFRPKDAAAITSIRRFAGSYTDACNVLESFISERSDYFVGHDLSKCAQQLGRFLAKSVARPAKRGEYGSQGGSIAASAATEAGREAIARRVARIEGAKAKNDGVVGKDGLP